LSSAVNSRSSLPVKFKGTRDRGLVVDIWIGDAGPFAFVLDTGAGTSLVTRRVTAAVGLRIERSQQQIVGGLSASSISSNQQTTLQNISIGKQQSRLTASVKAAVVEDLPAGTDGILDPLDVSPYGYSIDLPNETLEIFDLNHPPLRSSDVQSEGAVVRWIKGDNSGRPFVKLGDGRLAIIDTGSGFGLAVSDGVVAGNHGRQSRVIRDLGGGVVQSTRVAPTTVSIGSMELRSIPTDLLSGVASGTPVIIGRAALYPFKITFDPVARLIAIEPSEER